MLLGMLCVVESANHAMSCEVTSAKHAWVSLEKIWMGANGQTGGKNRSSTFVPTAFISFAQFITHPGFRPQQNAWESMRPC
jgi:hypothetical protein